MKKNELRLLVSAALLMMLSCYFFGVINTCSALYFAALAAIVTILVSMLIRSLRGLKNGGVE